MSDARENHVVGHRASHSTLIQGTIRLDESAVHSARTLGGPFMVSRRRSIVRGRMENTGVDAGCA